ncbi:MAG: YidC/Oxa1 family membrane protein insertase [Anaerolineae bacterium]|nr:YidC/Oxa1 family membrane protein insertase [Anaerolineae bacterium]
MDFILNPFITLVTFLYSVLGNNMVLAIIVFTVLVRLVTYPLTAHQLRSSKSMQQIQPKMKELQEKYKNDREKLSQAQMELYREHGVNPVGGCLPLFIQLPIFIALYQAIIFALAATPTQLLDLSGRLLIPGLDSAIPMNNSFLGMNLSQPPNTGNPIALAIICLVVITTYLQFKMTSPAPQKKTDGKPDQGAAMTQSMGTIMPVMYGFFALSFSIGLSIYFIVSNTIGIAQSWLMKRNQPPATAVATVPASAGIKEKPARPPKRTAKSK